MHKALLPVTGYTVNLDFQGIALASIRKRVLKSGKTRWTVDYRDQNGERRYKDFERKKEGEAFLDDVKRQLRDGTFVHDDATCTVAAAADLYLHSGSVRALEPGTQEGYDQHIRLYIRPHLGGVLLTKLTEPMIREFLDDLVEERSADMAKRVLGTLSRIIKEAQRRNLVGRNIIDDKSIKAPRVEPFVKRMPERHELSGLLANTQGGDKMLLMTAMLTGMRMGELRALTWDDVRFDDRIIRVRKASRSDGSTKRTKSASGQRDIPISGTLGLELKKWRLACPVGVRDLVFPNGKGNVESGSNIRQRIFIPAMNAIGLTTEEVGDGEKVKLKPVFRFHDLRHAAAALFIEQGMGPKRIQELMGHSSIKVTFDIYGGLFRDKEADAAAVDAISARLFGA
ncbi:MAG: tyrosine-type recombinase/integrase [Oceanicaulis sp.]